MTAQHLLARLADSGSRPAVNDGKLVFNTRPPADLVPVIRVLQSGLRAAISGRRWYACDTRTGRPCGPKPAEHQGRLAFGAIGTDRLIPHNAGLLYVEGDTRMDRIHPTARIDLPHLFEPPPAKATKPRSNQRAPEDHP